MPGSPTTPDRQSARNDALRRIAFRVVQRVCIRKNNLFVAQWLAYALPYRRFTCSLASTSARLGADAGRYAFIVVDFHHILPAGLPGAQTTGSQTVCSNPTRTFSTIAASLGTNSSISPGASCPSDCETGLTGFDQ